MKQLVYSGILSVTSGLYVMPQAMPQAIVRRAHISYRWVNPLFAPPPRWAGIAGLLDRWMMFPAAICNDIQLYRKKERLQWLTPPCGAHSGYCLWPQRGTTGQACADKNEFIMFSQCNWTPLPLLIQGIASCIPGICAISTMHLYVSGGALKRPPCRWIP